MRREGPRGGGGISANDCFVCGRGLWLRLDVRSAFDRLICSSSGSSGTLAIDCLFVGNLPLDAAVDKAVVAFRAWALTTWMITVVCFSSLLEFPGSFLDLLKLWDNPHPLDIECGLVVLHPIRNRVNKMFSASFYVEMWAFTLAANGHMTSSSQSRCLITCVE